MSDAYERAGVSQTAADSAVEALVRSLRAIDTGKAVARGAAPGSLRQRPAARRGSRAGALHRHGRHQDGRRRAPRPLRHDRDRLRGDERQRRDLRWRGADRDARLHPHRARRSGRLRAARDRAGQGRGARRDRDPRGRDRPGGGHRHRARAGRDLRRAGRSRFDRHRRRGRARRPGDRASLLRPALERLHPGPQGARTRFRWTTNASAARSARCCWSRPRSTSAAVLELLRSPVEVRGLVHITGDGLDNLLRLEAEVGYEIDDPLPVPPVFALIQELAEVSDDEMHRVFNMGCGFCCVVAAADEGPALELLRGHYPGARRIGWATDGAGEVRAGLSRADRDPDLRRAHGAGRDRSVRGPVPPAGGRAALRRQAGGAEANRHRRPGRPCRPGARRAGRARGGAGARRRGQPAPDGATPRCWSGCAPPTASSTWTTSVCTGALVLGAAGILDGKRATTHWAYLDRLSELGAEPVAQRVVEDGKVITAAGVSAGIDMALTLAEPAGRRPGGAGDSARDRVRPATHPSTQALPPRPRPSWSS